MAEISLGGFSGYDTQAMIDALVASQRVGIDRLAARKSKLTSAQAAWSSISGRLGVLGTAAAGLSTAAAASTTSLSSSDSSKVSVSGSPRSSVSLSIGVEQLARGSVYAVSGFTSAASAIGPGAVTLSRGLANIGASAASAQAVSGASLEVVQASAAAELAIASFPLTLNADLNVDFTATTQSGQTTVSVTLPSGTYSTAQDLADAISPAFAGSAIEVSASGERLVFSSKAHGSAAGLSASGDGASLLNALSSEGRDAVVVSGTQETVISTLESGGTVQVMSDSGAIELTIGSGGGLTAGVASVSSYSFDAQASLSDVSEALNSSQSKFNATVVGTGDATELIVASRDTGISTNVDVTWSGFTHGTVAQIGTAQDAQISVGSRIYTRESNTVTDLIAGATVSLNGTTEGSHVTLSSQSSPDRLVAAAKTFVSAFNDSLGVITAATAANPANPAQAGPLSSDSTARMLRRELVGSLNQVLGSGTYDRLASIGMSMSRAGQLTFDESTFKRALSESPVEVGNLLTRSLGGGPAWVSLKASPVGVPAGNYEVSITNAAAPAQVESTAFVQTPALETLTVSTGSSSLSVTLPIGSTPESAADLLNSRFAAAGLPAVAAASDSKLVISSSSLGSSVTLSVSSNSTFLGMSSLTSSGSDVAGLIAGEVATGTGDQLTATSGPAAGLALNVSASTSDVASADGTLTAAVTYQPGLTSLLRSALDRVTGTGGTVPNAQSSIAAAMRRLDDNVARAERLADLAESRIRRQFAALEAAVAMLRSSVPSFPSPLTGGQQ